MMLYGYCYFNRKAGFYTAPFFNQYEKEKMLELIERSYQGASPEEKKFMLECDFVYLGTFDDKSGAAVLEKPEYLRNFVEKEEVDDVK